MDNLTHLIKPLSFVLIHNSKNSENTFSSYFFSYMIMYVHHTGIDYTGVYGHTFFVFGTILKTNLKDCLFTTHKHYFNNATLNKFKIIDNKNEIEELTLLYKINLLKSS